MSKKTLKRKSEPRAEVKQPDILDQVISAVTRHECGGSAFPVVYRSWATMIT